MKRREIHLSVLSAALLFALNLFSSRAMPDQPADSKFAKWEKSIAAFEQADQKEAPPKQGVVFVGSSSIRLWDLKASFPDLPAINRGFGGSQIEDSVHFADRIVVPYQPKTVVFYAGDNDLASGKTPEQVAADFQAFVQKVQAKIPETRILFIAIKPSSSRWKIIDKQRDANSRIRKFCESNPKLTFVDVEPKMLGSDGQPRDELFRDDKLHLNSEGYRLWNELLRPHLQQSMK